VANKLAPYALLLLATLLSFHIITRIDLPRHAERIAFHERILRGDAPAPYRYRVLVPKSVELLRMEFAKQLGEDRAFQAAFALFDFLALLLLLASLFAYLRIWFDPGMSLLGVFAVSLTMLVAMADHFYQPWSLLEASLFPLALILIRRDWTIAFLSLVVIGALNRETSVFLPLLYLLGHWTLYEEKGSGHLPRRALAVALLAFALWAAIQLSLRTMLGAAEPVHSLPQLLAKNLDTHSLARTARNLGQFMLPFVFFIVPGFRRAPAFVKRTTLLLPPYLAAYLIWGIWYEMRLLMPLYSVLASLALFGLTKRSPAGP